MKPAKRNGTPRPNAKGTPRPGNGGDQRGPAALESTADRKATILRLMAERPHVGDACKAAGTDVKTCWRWRKDDADFDKAFAEAKEIGIICLEDEARRRGLTTSDVLLIFMLKAARPEVYRDRFEHQLVGKDGAPLQPVLNLTLNAAPPAKVTS